MHQQEIARIFLLADLLADTRRHRHRRNACGTNQRVYLTLCGDKHQLAKQHAASCAEAERQQAQDNNANGLRAQENFTARRCTNRHAQENRDNIHQFILRSVSNTGNNATLAHQIAQHQHANQRCRIGQQEGNQDGDDDREQNLFQLRNRAELFHNHRTLFLGRQRLHNRGLDNRDQGHVGIRRYSDRPQELRSQFGCHKDCRRAVCAADNRDCTGLLCSKGQIRDTKILNKDRADKSQEDTQLRGSSKQKALRVGDQGAEICHGANPQENQRRINTKFYALI